MIERILGERFVKLERESDALLYQSLRVPKGDLDRTFPWHTIMLKEILQERLDKAGIVAKVALGMLLTTTFYCVTTNTATYVARLVELETEALGEPIERLITNVSRSKVKGAKRSPRLVIEGNHLEKLGLVIGDKMDMFVVDATPSNDGYIVLKPRKRLK
jgi:hypothetical protein